MNKSWAIPIIVSILLFGTMGIQDVYGPPIKPLKDKIVVERVNWDSESQAFQIELKAKFGMVQAIENAGFTINTRISSADPGVIEFELSEGTLGQREDGAEKDSENFVKLKPISIEWDRNGGTYAGETAISVLSQIVNPGGKIVGSSPIFILDIDISPPSNSGLLSVQVIDADTGLDVENYQADIFNDDEELIFSTIRVGSFRVTLPIGFYHATFLHDDYVPGDAEFDIVAGLNDIVVELEPISAPPDADPPDVCEGDACTSDLALSLSTFPDQVFVGQPFTLIAFVENLGPATATSVQLRLDFFSNTGDPIELTGVTDRPFTETNIESGGQRILQFEIPSSSDPTSQVVLLIATISFDPVSELIDPVPENNVATLIISASIPQ